MKFSQLEIAEVAHRSAISPEFLPLPVAPNLAYARRWGLVGDIGAALARLRITSGSVDEQAYEAADHFFRKGYLP